MTDKIHIVGPHSEKICVN